MTGPLAALSPVSMAMNLAGGKSALGKDKNKTVYRNAPDRSQTVTALTPNGGAI